MKGRSALLIVLAAIVASLATAVPALSAGKWRPYRAEDFDLAAGERCDFALSGRVQEDRERIRTLERFRNGDPRLQEVRGRLVVKYVNQDSGDSIRRNLTGHAFFRYFRNGASELTLERGHFAAGLAEGDPGGPAFLVFTGREHSVRFTKTGRRVVHRGEGPVENVCKTLQPPE